MARNPKKRLPDDKATWVVIATASKQIVHKGSYAACHIYWLRRGKGHVIRREDSPRAQEILAKAEGRSAQ